MHLTDQPIPASRHRRSLQGKRVLVVEDGALVGMLIEDGLIDAGAEVVGPACSVSEALRLIEVASTDGGLSAAVLDINFDDEMVLSVADRLAVLGVPFIFVTDYPEGCDQGLHTTASRLGKPFDSDTLADAVRKLTVGR
jgi:DNA-binding response OmpR family regulator